MLADLDQNTLAGTRCLVTGGTGLIGRQVVKILCDAGARVRVASLDRLTVDDRAEHVIADLTDFRRCLELTDGMDYVLHVAGIKGSVEVTKSKPASFFVPLLQMNTNVLEAARRCGARRVVYTSSIGAYPPAEVFEESMGMDGPPMDMFPGWAKRMAELQVQAYKIQYGLSNFAVVRPCNVYGPGDNFDPETAMVIPTLMARIRRGDDPVTVWGDGSAIRDFAYARDVAVGVVLALLRGTGEYPVPESGQRPRLQRARVSGSAATSDTVQRTFRHHQAIRLPPAGDVHRGRAADHRLRAVHRPGTGPARDLGVVSGQH
jgi:GDP-L-fucose synthase